MGRRPGGTPGARPPGAARVPERCHAEVLAEPADEGVGEDLPEPDDRPQAAAR
ncbi:hypothetical protein [Streptomyces sp. LN245]|uniref:hypothetical protein n=1 Tax=Streptomyces sp. LN245 TaxID=3112975 RepID=UPI00371F52CD